MKERIPKSVAISAIIFSIIGGIYFGLFSCGGYVWHEQLFAVISIGLMLFILFGLPNSRIKLWKKSLFVASVSMLFLLARAGASAFYPAAPETWVKFFQSFIRGIQYGPC